MCGRYSNRFTWAELHALYSVFNVGAPRSTWVPRLNIPPTVNIPVLRLVDGARRFDLMRWGLVPSWSKEIGKYATHNCVGETMLEKASLSRAWDADRRCIIPASSFFEWRAADGDRPKQPFAIGLSNKGPLNLAGLWEAWKPKGAPADDAPLLSCTIITTKPNALMAPIHNRMPVIIGEENLDAWLSPDTEQAALMGMVGPFDATRMKVWPVDKRVGNARVEDEGLDQEVVE